MKTCLVTGASGGIGSEIAKALAKEGYFVYLQGRNIEKLEKVKSTTGVNSEIIVGDLNNKVERESVLNTLFGRSDIDLLVNAAGISQFSAFEDTDDVRIAQIIQTNLLTPMLFIQDFIQMKNRRASAHSVSIVNVGSAFGYIGYPGFSAYSASKFGLRGFTESLRREYSDTRFKFAYFAPRATQTEINTTQVNDMNKALGNAVDSPQYVAMQFISFMNKHQNESTLGWPEKLFVKLNSLLPKVVDKAIKSKLPLIKQYMSA